MRGSQSNRTANKDRAGEAKEEEAREQQTGTRYKESLYQIQRAGSGSQTTKSDSRRAPEQVTRSQVQQIRLTPQLRTLCNVIDQERTLLDAVEQVQDG